MAALGIAFTGYGSIARAHAQALQKLRDSEGGPALRFQGVMGRLEEPSREFAREFGFETATTDLDSLLADQEVDAVVITSPTDVHVDQTARALEAGKHVLCEIPLSTTLEEADRLTALAEQVGRRLMVCHTERFYAPLMEIRRRVEAGEFHPYAITGRYLFKRRENVNWMGRQRSWTDNLLWHHAAHTVDMCLWLLGAEHADTVAQVAAPSGPLDIPMDLSLAMRTPANQIATVVMTYNTFLPLHDYMVIGEETTLVYEDGNLRDRDQVLMRGETIPTLNEGVYLQDAEFVAAVEEGREPSVSGRAIRPAMAALQAAQDTLNARLSG